MTTNALASLEHDATTAKRAQYEAFEFDLEAPGLVRVRNGSYGNDADEHTYRVTVENGVPTSCTCKADEYGSGACKHRVAIAIRNPVLEAATNDDPVADGVVPVGDDACRNGQVGCGGPDGDELPCFECFREVSGLMSTDSLASHSRRLAARDAYMTLPDACSRSSSRFSPVF